MKKSERNVIHYVVQVDLIAVLFIFMLYRLAFGVFVLSQFEVAFVA